jgi:glyoxylase-like metal-dependent hydrolase (beta-lactamase superfamily II)
VNGVSPADGGATALTFPHETEPAAGTVTKVAPGVHWLRMPLPFRLNHINLWLLEDGGGWTIVDTGIDSPPTRAAWEAIFANALDGRKVTRVIVTHFHPDHMGLAGWLTRRWGVALWVTEGEWLWGRMMSDDRDDAGFAADQMPFYVKAGVGPATVRIFAGKGNPYAPQVSAIPRSYHRLVDGMTVEIGGRSWTVIVGRGHAPEHACLYCPELGLFIAGDQVLPKISPNVSVWPTEPEGNPLARFLGSLETIRRAVPADVLVLPSHNLPFHGLHTRIDQLVQHHQDRLAEVMAACAEPHSASEIVPLMFRRDLDPHQLVFAIGEALAHLHLLAADGRLARSEGADGICRFVAVAE